MAHAHARALYLWHARPKSTTKVQAHHGLERNTIFSHDASQVGALKSHAVLIRRYAKRGSSIRQFRVSLHLLRKALANV